jgi:VanZ family protein
MLHDTQAIRIGETPTIEVITVDWRQSGGCVVRACWQHLVSERIRVVSPRRWLRMNLITAPALRHTWVGIGWFGVALLLFLSLTPRSPEISGHYGDKIGHVLAYALLTYWWAQFLVTSRARCGLATALMLLGVAIEHAQGWTGWRTFDYRDMLADGLGIALGWGTVTLTPNVLLLLGRHVGRSD